MNNLAFLLSVVLLSAGIALTVIVGSRDLPIIAVTNIERLPVNINGFVGGDDRYTDAIYAELNADLYLYRHYRSDAGQALDLYIGYYGTAKGGRSTHNPNACLPGAGWAITATQAVELALDGEPSKQVRYLAATRDGSFVIIYHWYQSNKNEVLGSGISQNIARLKNRLLHNRDDGAFVQVSLFSTKDNLVDARRIGFNFARKVTMLLADYWPEETGKG